MTVKRRRRSRRRDDNDDLVFSIGPVSNESWFGGAWDGSIVWLIASFHVLRLFPRSDVLLALPLEWPFDALNGKCEDDEAKDTKTNLWCGS